MKKIIRLILIVIVVLVACKFIFGKSVPVSELTGESGQKISAALYSVIDDLKGIVNETSQMTDAQLRDRINEIAAKHNLTLTDKQVNQLLSLARTFKNLDPDSLQAKVDETVKKLTEAKEEASGFFAEIRNAVNAAEGFFSKASSLFG